MQTIPSSVETLLKTRSMMGTDAPRCVVTFTKGATSETVQVASARISKGAAELAQRCVLTWPNVNPTDSTDGGYYSPDRGDDNPADQNAFYQLILPGTTVVVQQGYGSDLATVFTGEIDEVAIGADPAGGELYSIQVDARDRGAWLIDKTVNDGAGNYRLSYTNTDVSNIVVSLLQYAGWSVGDIGTPENTGIAATVTFEDQTFAEAVAWCQEVTGFALYIAEDGDAYWYYETDRQPVKSNDPAVLTGITAVALTESPIVANSEVVTDITGAITYVEGTDYTLDYGAGTIARIALGAITDGQTVYVDYVYAAWTWQEGVDLARLGYTISRHNVYGKILVRGAEHTGTYTYANRATYGVDDNKVLFVDLAELTSQAQVDAAAAQLGNDMIPHVREIQFAAIGNPWIQRGDCVRIIEASSTVSEIYRLTSLELELDERGFIMTGTANYYGYSPL